MKPEGEFLFALPIEQMPLGAEYPAGTRLPLHCTVMHWFQLRCSFREFCQLLEWTSTTKGLELYSLEPALFEPDNTIPVHLVRLTEPLVLLHNALFYFLASIHSLPEERRWIGAGYKPHVTSTDREFSPGSHQVPRYLVLVERRKDRVKKVLARWDLELSVLTAETAEA